MSRQCEGQCLDHRGEVRQVCIRGPWKRGRPWYCSVAIEADRERGMIVEVIDLSDDEERALDPFAEEVAAELEAGEQVVVAVKRSDK